MGGTLLSAVIDSAQKSDFDMTYVVVSRETLSVVTSWGYNRVQFVLNEKPEAGQSGSLQLGLRAIESKEDSFCILLGDMPMVTSEVLRGLRSSFLELPQNKSAMIPVRDGRFGHPSWFRPIWKHRLLESSGDMGGREIIGRYKDEVSFISGADYCFFDVDTPRDYELLKGKEVCPPAPSQ
jgi:molybdenum cofactor cytidylyltransferase